jgi:molybdopterin-binding protein/molybdate transport repressor ModE-like protein
MSYKAAWDAIDAMNNLAGEALVERLAGGKGGGGTRLTARGAQLVANFRLIEREHRNFVQRLSEHADGIADDYSLVRKMSMRTSARNQFSGTVTQLRRGAVNDEIALELAGGHAIVAIVTHESVDNLGLQLGSEAFALVKSSSIILVTGEDGARYSARNRLAGTIVRVEPGRREHGSGDRAGGRRRHRRHRHQGKRRDHGTGGRRACGRHLQGLERHHRPRTVLFGGGTGCRLAAFAPLAADGCHVLAVAADRFAAFLAGAAGLLRIEFMGRAFLVSGLSALAGDAALGCFVHCCKTALGGAFGFGLIVA